eukprot:TRINITY_DN58_c0_g2_i1.p2 TRINITY_DN58_c0_g2~~TRINITY_DN58_c0_g2_i1.p2  ORF type:complete len:206 (-),score=128.24 TRINITY_DN58_c0_g2_i1:185-802(-)
MTTTTSMSGSCVDATVEWISVSSRSSTSSFLGRRAASAALLATNEVDVDVDDDDSCTSGQVAPNGDELNALHLDTTLVDAVLDAMLRPAHSSYVPAASAPTRGSGFFASCSLSSSLSSSSSAPAALPSPSSTPQTPGAPPRRLLTALFRCVLALRQRRRGMVQTCEQYRFVATCVSAAAASLARRHRLADSGGMSSASSDDDFAL